MDRGGLIAALGATAQAMGQTVTDDALIMMADDLEGYSEPDIVAALKAVRRQRARFSIALILDYLTDRDGRPSADKAWAMVPKSDDESAVMTNEMGEALSVADASIVAGDMIGASIAFKREYQRIVDKARMDNVPVRWYPSLGFAPGGRDEVLLAAFSEGKLGLTQVSSILDPKSLPRLAELSGDEKLLEDMSKEGTPPPKEVEEELKNTELGRMMLKQLKQKLR